MMKSIPFIAAVVFTGLNVFAHGVIGFANNSGTLISNRCTAQLTEPGTNFLAGLYLAPNGETNESLFVLSTAPTPFRSPGRFVGSGYITNASGWRAAQVRVWEAAFGATFEEAEVAPAQNGRGPIRGKSSIFTAYISEIEAQPPPGTLPSFGFKGFAIGLPECLEAGHVWFENGTTTLVTNLCTGEPAFAGTNFLARLYSAPDGVADPSFFTPLGPPSGFGPQPGVFRGGARTPPGTSIPGQFAMFQVRVWEAAFGADYEQAVAAPPQDSRRAIVGVSSILRLAASLAGEAPTSLISNGLTGIILGYPDCATPGTVLFQNSPAILVTNLCTAEPVVPGTNFLAALYSAPDGVTNENLMTALSEAIDFGPEPGRFHGGVRFATNGTAPGEFAMFQTRIWESEFGATYEEALAAPARNGRRALTGKSTIVRVPTMGAGAPVRAPLEAGNSAAPIFIGALDCNPPGSILFQNSLTTLVTHGCNGQPLPIGTNFLAAVYYASAGVSNDAFFVQLGESVGIGPQPGRFQGGPRVAPSTTAPGESAIFQVRVWEAAFGATYEQARSAAPRQGRAALTGKSALLTVPTRADAGPVAPAAALSAGNLQGFNVGYARFAVLFENDPTTLAYDVCTRLPLPVGPGFLAAMYYAPDPFTTESQFIRLGDPAPFGPGPGQFQSGWRTLPLPLFPGEFANVQVRVWESAFGATFEEAIAAAPFWGRPAKTGVSAVVRLWNLGECLPANPSPSLVQAGLKFFHVGGATCTDPRADFAASGLALPTEHLKAGAAGDLDGDGADDVVLLTTSGERCHVLISRGDGTFALNPRGPVPMGGAHSIGLGDLNGDGRIDLLAAIPTMREVRVFPGLGDGTFAPPITNLVAFEPSTAIAADFNGDGILDVATAHPANSTIALLVGDGSGRLTETARWPQLFKLANIAAADWNDDCRPGVLATSDENNDLTVLLNEGGTNFVLSTALALPRHAGQIAAADFNGDGQVDLAGIDAGLNSLTLLLGTGDLALNPVRTWLGPGLELGFVMVGDFNGDGRPDIWVGDMALYITFEGGRTFSSVLLNQTDLPRLSNDTASISEDTPILLDVLANDSRAGVPLSIRAVSTPAHGSAFIYGGTNILYVPDSNFFGADSFAYSIAGCDARPAVTATVTVTVLSVNDGPSPVARAISPTSLAGLETTADLVAISSNNTNALIRFDASHSSDIENDPLQFFWVEDTATNAFAFGARATSLVAVGTHTVRLFVTDGVTVETASLTVEVLTPCEAVGLILAVLEDASTGRATKASLLPSLNAACASFDQNRMATGTSQLRAFQNKLRAQVEPSNQLLAATLNHPAQQIINALSTGASKSE